MIFINDDELFNEIINEIINKQTSKKYETFVNVKQNVIALCKYIYFKFYYFFK